MKWINSKVANEVVPEEDVIRRTEDGREIVVARKGSPLPRAKAIQLGLIKDDTKADADAKAETAKSNKSAKAAENKTEKADEK